MGNLQVIMKIYSLETKLINYIMSIILISLNIFYGLEIKFV